MKAKKEKKQLGIPELAKSMGLKEATVRIKLREAKVKRSGRTYAWKTPSEVEAVARRLNAA